MNDTDMAQIENSEHDLAAKQDKPRGVCTGCAFDYQLSTARSGEFKGQLVIRKHNSRVGPGLCDGAAKPPRSEADDECACGGADQDCPNGCNPSPEFADPAPAGEQRPDVPPVFYASFDSGGSCGHRIGEGELIQADGTGGYMCSNCIVEPESRPRPEHIYNDGNGGVWVHSGLAESCTIPECVQARNLQNPPPVTTPVTHQCDAGLYADMRNCPVHGVRTESVQVSTGRPSTELPHDQGSAPVFADPAPAPAVAPVPALADPAPVPAELPSVSGQPEPDRDGWGRYKIHGKSHTRATTFAKLGSSTFALGEWNERMLIRGLTMRPDLIAMAHGLDVKLDRATLNKIADDAQAHAGAKIAANIGTAYHKFTEQLDAGLIGLSEVPAGARERCTQYLAEIARYGLTTRLEWIERTTAVRADQVSAPVPVAGTLDRIFQLPNGDLVIGDLKTSSNIDYGWAEIAVQLALYAHGVNTHGLFDWNTKTWQKLARPVRTDYAIVIHLPAAEDGCRMHRVDLVKGWEYAQVSGRVQSRQKDKSVASRLVVTETNPNPAPVVTAAPVESDHLILARSLVRSAQSTAELEALYGHALSSGLFDAGQLELVKAECGERWNQLQMG